MRLNAVLAVVVATIIGLPVPAAKGQRPQTWTLVARHSGAAST